ncbi:MAG: hypothetical protein EKK49_14990 [Rhodocyclaceae bacterium]|nr:MAG: hypothetical protein EKK49_14990 [Rhodocyclaceae bacterium]
MKPITRYCISHAEPMLPPYWFDDAIALGEYEEESPLHISRLHNFWHKNRSLSFGAAGSYALPRALEQLPPEYQLVGICSYRKAILRRPLGRPSESYPTMREMERHEAEPLDASEMSPTGEHEFLLAQPRHFPTGLFHQYALVHELVDLLDYTSLAINNGILDKAAAADFVREQVIIPGGCELGIYPRQWLAGTLSALSTLGKTFLETYGSRIRGYNIYQIRAVGFLSERLGSFLLMRELKRRYPQGAPPEVFGHMTCIIEDGRTYAASTTNT